MTTSESDCVYYSWTTAKRRRVSVSCKWIIFLVFTVIPCTHCQIPYRNCEPEPGQFEACVPSPEKIFQNTNTTVTVEPSNATCGLTEIDAYLKLGDTGEVFRCQVGQHTKAMMIDANITSWWQSKTWTIEQYDATQPNPQYAVTLTFSITKTYRMNQNITLTFNSGRPQKMVIEKSSDHGVTWVPLQYYARDCDEEYPNASRSYANNLTAVICTEIYSEDTNNPQAGRKVFFPGSSERMKALSLDDYYVELEKPEMQQFLKFTNIRVRLLYPATDAKEFSRQRQDFYRYYYAIYDIDVTGSCFCNMHGSGCMSNLNGESVCDCSHNTEGVDCEKCKPLYNNKPWKEGSFLPPRSGTPNACEKCECYDHADSCTYDSSLGSGVCDNCQHNTTGVKCDECLDTFYPNISALLNDTNVCKDCDCEILGLMDTNNTSCQKNRALPDIGQCTCKSLVTGRRCDRCEDEYYGLLDPGSPGTCKECQCNRYGTADQSNVCDYTTGQCRCKVSTDGRLCDKCKEGFFQFPSIPSNECQDCGCDPGGSTTFVCEVQFGMCTCIPHVLGTKCTQVETLFYIPALDQFIKQPESGDCPIESDLWTASKPFDGDVFATCPPTSPVTVNFESILGTQEQFEVAWPYIVSVRYSLSELIVRTGGEVIVTVTGNSNVDLSRYATNGQAPTSTCPATLNTEYNFPVNFTNGDSKATTGEPHVTLDKRCTYSLKLSLPAKMNATFPIVIDSVVLLPSLSNPDTGKEFRTLNESSDRAANYEQCIRKLASLSSRSSAMESSPCKELLWSAAAELYREGKQCQCNPIGTVGDTCNPNGGQCTCKPGVGGRRCDDCLPGYYNLTSTGCTECPTKPCPMIIITTTTSKSPNTIVIPDPTDIPNLQNTTTPNPLVTENSTESPTTGNSNGTMLDTSQPKLVGNFNGLYLGLGLGLAAVFLACIGLIVLFPKAKLRKCNCFQKNRGSDSEECNNIRIIHRGPGGNLGSHDPRNTLKQEDGNTNLAWISQETNGRYSPSFADAKQDLEDGYDIPTFYLGQVGSSSINRQEPGHDRKIQYEVEPKPSKPKLKDIAQSSVEGGIDYSRDFEVDIIPPPPSFNTFKSDNPITLPAITVTKADPPKKPKRKKKPKSRSIKPVKLTDDNQVDADSYNKSVDDNRQNEILLQSQTHVYAGIDDFDETNGSLV